MCIKMIHFQYVRASFILTTDLRNIPDIYLELVKRNIHFQGDTMSRWQGVRQRKKKELFLTRPYCFWCGHRFQTPQELTRDHVIPKYRMRLGPNNNRTVQSCYSCNNRRSLFGSLQGKDPGIIQNYLKEIMFWRILYLKKLKYSYLAGCLKELDDLLDREGKTLPHTNTQPKEKDP